MKHRKLSQAFVLAASAWMLSGCLSMQSQTTVDNVTGALPSKPFVEAFVEYRGPADRWAGPTSFLLHVVAKDTGPAQITVVPSLFGAPAETERKLASETTKPAATTGMTGEVAREQMGKLAAALQGVETPFRGCLSPVRVRLVRADGSLVEKTGCRAIDGWSKAASEAVAQFITASVGA